MSTNKDAHRFALSGERLERERKREREWERKREQQIMNKIEIDTYLFVKWNEQIKLGRFRQRASAKKSKTKKHQPDIS